MISNLFLTLRQRRADFIHDALTSLVGTGDVVVLDQGHGPRSRVIVLPATAPRPTASQVTLLLLSEYEGPALPPEVLRARVEYFARGVVL